MALLIPQNSSGSGTSGQSSNKRPNVLHEYTTYNYVFTLSSINFNEINDNSYRRKPVDQSNIILRTAGGFPTNRVETVAGKFDFYLDDLQIQSAVGMDRHARNTNATGISFKIYEPYSIGLFYQSLLIAARKAGFSNFLGAPYLLTIEFLGHKSSEKPFHKIPNTTKQISLKIANINMTVNGQGAVYEIDAYPWNEQAYNRQYMQLPVDTSVQGKTVLEMCTGIGGSSSKNLMTVVNQRFLEQSQKRGDQFEDLLRIVFPKDATSKENDNDIAKSNLNFNDLRTAHPGMARETLAFIESTGVYDPSKIKADPNLAEFKFSQGNDLVNCINQIILRSDYAKQALSNIDENGMVNWWRIVTQFEIFGVSENDLKKDGTPVYDIYVKVIPHKVHISKFSHLNSKLKGLENLRNNVIKEYNYIYTGKNLDILDFNIKFDASFYIPVAADLALNSGDLKINSQLSNTTQENPRNQPRQIRTENPNNTESPVIFRADSLSNSTLNAGGGGLDNDIAIAARQFHEVVTSAASLLTLDLTILGDPFYLGTSGMGNYYSKPTGNKNINEDQEMEFVHGEHDIIVSFRNPIDPDLAKGTYKFPTAAAGTKVVEQISGLYQIFTLDSSFSKGRFTQTLHLTRRLGQFTNNAENELLIKPAEFKESNNKL